MSIDPFGTDATADDQDWCARDERITYWDGEVCRACGSIWGTGTD